MSMNASDIISVLKSEIADFDRKSALMETGTVVRVGDGIATVFGLQKVMYGELVEFENGTRGIVQNIEAKTIGVVMLGSDRGITEGSQVVRTKTCRYRRIGKHDGTCYKCPWQCDRRRP